LSASAVRPEPEWTLSQTICTNSANDGAGPVRFGAGGASDAGAIENPKDPLTAGGMGAATGGAGGGFASSAFCKLNHCGQNAVVAAPMNWRAENTGNPLPLSRSATQIG
jgi:hypothetical protein